MNELQLNLKYLSLFATKPSRGNVDDAGLDLSSAQAITIPSGHRGLVRTDISIEIPKGYYGRVAPRSGLALKNGIDVFAGVIDSGFRGAIGVILFNSGGEDFEVSIGDRIAQLIIEAHYNFPIVETDNLSETSRNEGGFGSTGV